MKAAAEDLLSYSTAKMVKIKDRRLGALSLAATIAVLIYICFVMFSDQQYLYRETPVGTVRLSLKAAKMPKTNDTSTLPAYCLNSPASGTYNSSRLLLDCLFLDENSPGFEGFSLNSIYLPTRINTSVQALPVDCTSAGSPGCTFQQVSNAAYYTANADNWTFKISSTANAPTLAVKGSSSDVPSRIARCKGSDGVQRYRKLDGDEILTLTELLTFACWEDKPVSSSSSSNSNDTVIISAGSTVRQWIGTTLEQPSDHPATPPLSSDPKSPTFESIRYAGAIVTLAAEFDNTYTFWTKNVRLTYRLKRTPLTEYKTQFTLPSSDPTRRTVFSSHGIIIIASIFGVFAKPRFQEFLVNLTSGLGLLAFSTFLVEFIMLHVLKEKKEYEKEKNSDSERDFDLMRARLQREQEMYKNPGANADHARRASVVPPGPPHGLVQNPGPHHGYPQQGHPQQAYMPHGYPPQHVYGAAPPMQGNQRW
jgi:hypothetical protein